MNDRARELERFIERARMDAPSTEQLARGRERLLSNIMNPPPGSSSGGHGSNAPAGHASTTAAASGSVAVALKIMGASVLLGVGAIALRASLASHASEPVRSVPQMTAPVTTPAPAAPQNVVNAPPADEAQPISEPAQAAPHHTGAHAARKIARASMPQKAGPSAAPEKPTDPAQAFAREVALLRAAIEAHRRGDDVEARKKLTEHERAYPNSQLSQERGLLASELDAKP